MKATYTNDDIAQELRASVQHSGAMCRVKRLEYDFVARTGILFMMALNCTDMLGCIALFKAVDPEVRRIRTVAGIDGDTEYRLVAGSWRSYPHHIDR
jgi:hypothetical protein